MEKTINENAEIMDLQIRYGSCASEAAFDYPCHFFRLPNLIGTIPYRLESDRAIVFGDPLCPQVETEALTNAFHKFCQDSNLKVIYMIVSEKFVQLVKGHCPISIEVCEELIFDPQVKILSSRAKSRINKTIKHGLTFHEYIPLDEELEKAILEVGAQWQKAHPSMIHLGHLNFFENRLGKRWFYVKEGDRITSMCMLCKLEGQGGWLLKFFCSLPDALTDTSEFTFYSLLNTLREENCRFLTKAMVPVDEINNVKGLGNFTFLVKYLYKTIERWFQFKKHKEYWLRHHPEIRPAYLLFSNERIGFNDLRALLRILKTHS